MPTVRLWAFFTLAMAACLIPAEPAGAVEPPVEAREQFDLGCQYMEGNGVAENQKQATYCFTQAAKQGYAPAQFNLGVRYERGIGVSPNDRHAAAWYKKAAAQGHLLAINNYAYFLWTGKGVRKNAVEARRRFQQAADNDLAIAQDNLAQMHRTGEGGRKPDLTEAVRLVTAAAMTGYAYAQTRLGSWYGGGTVLPRNPEEALYWSLLAARQGVAFARDRVTDFQRELTPAQSLKVEQRVAAFRPMVRRDRTQEVDLQEFTITPDELKAGDRFDLVFRYTYTDPEYAKGTPLPVEVSIDILQGDRVLLVSKPQTIIQANGQPSQITRRNIQAGGPPGTYSLFLNLHFKYRDAAAYQHNFFILE